MATISNVRGTPLQIVNEVQRRLGYSETGVSANRAARKYLDFLNDTLAAVSDYGDWPQLYQEVTVTAAACAIDVEINASAPVKRIYEVAENPQVSPLLPRPVEDIRLLQRTTAAGPPRQYAVINTSGVNPIIRLDRARQTTAMGFNVAVYTMHRLLGSAESGDVLPFSSRLLVQGTYAAALLDENDGVPTKHWEANATLFTGQLREEYNRLQSDTGTNVQLILKR